jgi:enamine deaminase RidA (YjgF/YER057c/UK114 family)
MKKILWAFSFLLSTAIIAQTPEEKLTAAGLELPAIPAPVANYVNVVRSGNLLFLAGKGPLQKDGKYITGKLGKDLNIEQGYEAAKLTALIQLAVKKL